MLWIVILVAVLSGAQALAAENPAESPQSIQPVGPVSPPFPDVPKNHWAFEAVEKVRKAGIMIGYPDGTFGGSSARSSAERAAFKGWGRDALRKLIQEGIWVAYPASRQPDRASPTDLYRPVHATDRPTEWTKTARSPAGGRGPEHIRDALP